MRDEVDGLRAQSSETSTSFSSKPLFASDKHIACPTMHPSPKRRRLKAWLLRCIPGTRPFAHSLRRRVVRSLRERIITFSQLRALDVATKRRLLRPVRHHFKYLARVSASADVIVNYLFAALGLTLIIIICLAPHVTTTWLQSNEPKLASLDLIHLILDYVSGLVFLYLIPLAFGINVLVGPTTLYIVVQRNLNREPSEKVAFSSMIVWHIVVLASVYMCIAISHNGATLIATLQSFPYVVAGMLAAIAVVIVMDVFMGSMYAVVYLSHTRMNSAYPASSLIGSLLQVLSIIENKSSEWSDCALKCSLMRQMEIAATCIQYGLVRRLRSGDIITDAWMRGRAEDTAAAFRRLKRWILTPKADTQEYFIERIVMSFVHAVEGDWDALERVTPDSLTRPQRLARIVSLLRAVFIAALPILILKVPQVRNMVPGGSVADSLNAGAVIWGVFSLLAAIDPLLSVKLTMLKDVGILSFGKGKEK